MQLEAFRLGWPFRWWHNLKLDKHLLHGRSHNTRCVRGMKPQLPQVRYFQPTNSNNYAAINREYNKVIVIVCELISKREKSSEAKIIIVIGQKPMFSAVLGKVDALNGSSDGHSRHAGVLKNLLAAKLRKVLEKRENMRKFSGCGSGGGICLQIQCRGHANRLKRQPW